jgi:N-acetylneuraminate lyase
MHDGASVTTKFRLRGLVPATFTPMHADGRLKLEVVPALVSHARAHDAAALFACGTTGESASLSREEREAVVEAFVAAASGHLPVVAHVGHTALPDACALAAHAQRVGATAIAALPPFYFKPSHTTALVDCMADIAAAAPALPFYYYHIPHLSGVALSMVEFLDAAAPRIPTLAGIKYTAPTLHEFLSCAAHSDGRFDLVFGMDEMLLGGLAVGASGAVGSTYNFAAPLYRQMVQAFAEGRMAEARRLQLLSARMVEIIRRWRPLPALKAMMRLAGVDCGPVRAPLTALTTAELDALEAELAAIDFLKWMRR